MRIKDAIANIHKSHVDDTLNPLYTKWGENLDKENIWQEYPRPQMRREHYQMLHGEWDYAIVSKEDTDDRQSENENFTNEEDVRFSNQEKHFSGKSNSEESKKFSSEQSSFSQSKSSNYEKFFSEQSSFVSSMAGKT